MLRGSGLSIRSNKIPAMIALILGAIIFSTSSANAFELSCALVDPGTGLERYTYAPGEEVNLRAKLDVSEEEIDETLELRSIVSISVSGFKLSVDLGNWFLEVPPIEEREMIEGYEDAEAHLPEKADLEVDKIVKLPSKLPTSKAKITIFGKIDRLPRQVCQRTIQIQS